MCVPWWQAALLPCLAQLQELPLIWGPLILTDLKRICVCVFVCACVRMRKEDMRSSHLLHATRV